MEILDAHLHASEEAAGQLTVAELGAEMDAVGVDGAVLVQRWVDGPDNEYLLRASAAEPGRFAFLGVLGPEARDVAATLAGWRERVGAFGLRIVLRGADDPERLARGGYDEQLGAAQAAGVPLFLYPPGLLGEVEAIARRFPDLALVIDHLGLAAPPVLPAGDRPFAELPTLLALAAHDNVAVKLTGTPGLSAAPYPFADLWPHLHRVLDAFGPERVIWGSDITRIGDLHSYHEAVDYILLTDQLSQAEKALLMAGSLRRWLSWAR